MALAILLCRRDVPDPGPERACAAGAPCAGVMSPSLAEDRGRTACASDEVLWPPRTMVTTGVAAARRAPDSAVVRRLSRVLAGARELVPPATSSRLFGSPVPEGARPGGGDQRDGAVGCGLVRRRAASREWRGNRVLRRVGAGRIRRRRRQGRPALLEALGTLIPTLPPTGASTSRTGPCRAPFFHFVAAPYAILLDGIAPGGVSA